jgi:hypothetical protein
MLKVVMDACGCKNVVKVFLSSPLLRYVLFTNYVHLQILVGRNNLKPSFTFVLFLNHFWTTCSSSEK